MVKKDTEKVDIVEVEFKEDNIQFKHYPYCEGGKAVQEGSAGLHCPVCGKWEGLK